MKLNVVCWNCALESNAPTYNFSSIEFNDDGLYTFTCDKGHTNIVFLQQHKFEILFDMGALALLDGYYREAVANFAASLERFLEYCIEVFLIAQDVSIEAFDTTWKKLSNYSERQLGAYYALYLQHFKKRPPLLDENKSAFRNKVIHQGKFPSYDEALSYAEYVYDYIINVAKDLRRECKAAITEQIFRRQQRLQSKNNQIRSAMGISTIINMALADELFGSKSLQEALVELRSSRPFTYSR